MLIIKYFCVRWICIYSKFYAHRSYYVPILII
nr:MAG TPA: hypothetical protein [Crassvirales sp.]